MSGSIVVVEIFEETWDFRSKIISKRQKMLGFYCLSIFNINNKTINVCSEN